MDEQLQKVMSAPRLIHDKVLQISKLGNLNRVSDVVLPKDLKFIRQAKVVFRAHVPDALVQADSGIDQPTNVQLHKKCHPLVRRPKQIYLEDLFHVRCWC